MLSIKYNIYTLRFAFQVTGTLVVFALLWILLAELPQAGNSPAVNHNHTLISTTSCGSDDASNLNFGDAKAFWVSWSSLNL